LGGGGRASVGGAGGTTGEPRGCMPTPSPWLRLMLFEIPVAVAPSIEMPGSAPASPIVFRSPTLGPLVLVSVFSALPAGKSESGKIFWMTSRSPLSGNGHLKYAFAPLALFWWIAHSTSL